MCKNLGNAELRPAFRIDVPAAAGRLVSAANCFARNILPASHFDARICRHRRGYGLLKINELRYLQASSQKNCALRTLSQRAPAERAHANAARSVRTNDLNRETVSPFTVVIPSAVFPREESAFTEKIRFSEITPPESARAGSDTAISAPPKRDSEPRPEAEPYARLLRGTQLRSPRVRRVRAGEPD
jgi:hypothetical protein